MMGSWLTRVQPRCGAFSSSFVRDADRAESSARPFTGGCPRCTIVAPSAASTSIEAGYFLGAMYISYGLALAVIFAIGAALRAVTRWRVDKIALWAMLLFVPFVSMLTFLSRVLWIYLDQKIDPEREP